MFSMKITFIGSSHGVPEPNRRCTCMMVEVAGRYYFVDMGAMAMDALITRGISPNEVKGIFISHMHGDHTDGLVQFVDLCSWYFKEANPVFCVPKIEFRDALRHWLDVTGDPMRDFEFRDALSGVIYDDGVLKVTSFPTKHCEKSRALLLEAEGKAVLFTGDLKNPQVDFPAAAKEKPLDLLVCECAHFPATDYIPALEGCNIKKICMTHYSPRYMPTIPAFTEKLEMPFVLATDGLELTV